MRSQILRSGSFLFVATAVVAFVVAGCTDMTTQQYAQQQAQQQVEQDNAVAGTYNGSITSLDGNSSIGGIQVIIDSGAQPISSADGTTMSAQATLTGSVRLIGATTSEAPFTATYGANTGTFDATITIPDNPNLTLKMNATISGGNLDGSIVSNQYGDEGGKFNATLNGSLPTAQGASSGQPVSHLSQYGGSASFDACTIGDNTCDVSMSIDDTPSSSADAFSDALTSVSDVVIHVTVTMGEGLSGTPNSVDYTFGGSNGTAELNQRDGSLDGQSPAQGVNTTDKLSCVAIASNAISGWSCTLDKISFRVAPAAPAAK